MPVYVYKNLQTGDVFELRQSITDPALSVHPETGEPVKRVVQPVGIAFKGSGFYVTDSRKKDAPTASTTKEAKSESKSEGKSESASESKPAKTAAKSETKAASSKD